ncbi:MAG: hypothetical protein QM607_10765 [Microbacterium sp.]
MTTPSPIPSPSVRTGLTPTPGRALGIAGFALSTQTGMCTIPELIQLTCGD